MNSNSFSKVIIPIFMALMLGTIFLLLFYLAIHSDSNYYCDDNDVLYVSTINDKETYFFDLVEYSVNGDVIKYKVKDDWITEVCVEKNGTLIFYKGTKPIVVTDNYIILVQNPN